MSSTDLIQEQIHGMIDLRDDPHLETEFMMLLNSSFQEADHGESK